MSRTPAGQWQIRYCGLNADHLVEERQRRAAFRDSHRKFQLLTVGDFDQVRNILEQLLALDSDFIPDILPPPPEGTSPPG